MRADRRGRSGGNRQGGISLTVFPVSGPAQPQGYATDATCRATVAWQFGDGSRDATHSLESVALSRPLRCWGDSVRGSPPWTALRDAPVAGMLVGPSGGCALPGARSPDMSARRKDSESGKPLRGKSPRGGNPCWGDLPVTPETRDAITELVGPEWAAPVESPETVTAAELGEWRGLNPNRVRALGRDRVLPLSADKTYPLRASVRAYADHARQIAKGKARDTDLAAEKVRLAREQADKIAFANARARGELLDRREVATAWRGVVVEPAGGDARRPVPRGRPAGAGPQDDGRAGSGGPRRYGDHRR